MYAIGEWRGGGFNTLRCENTCFMRRQYATAIHRALINNCSCQYILYKTRCRSLPSFLRKIPLNLIFGVYGIRSLLLLNIF